jgi:hypothetical protein
MIAQMQELMTEKTQALADQVQKMRKESAESVREAFSGSAESLKAMKSPVRVLARSGIKVSAVSQTAVQSLIELQSDVITSALTDVALRLERATRAENVVDFVKDQIELLPATRARIVEDATRVVTIFKSAGRDLRTVATHAYEMVTETAEEHAPAAKPARRKGKRAVRKTTRARKAA